MAISGGVETGPAATSWKGRPYGNQCGLYCDYPVNPANGNPVDGSRLYVLTIIIFYYHQQNTRNGMNDCIFLEGYAWTPGGFFGGFYSGHFGNIDILNNVYQGSRLSKVPKFFMSNILSLGIY